MTDRHLRTEGTSAQICADPTKNEAPTAVTVEASKMNPGYQEGFTMNATTTKPEAATPKPAANAEVFTLDGPPRATDWLTIGRCALDRLQVDLDKLLTDGDPMRQEDSAEMILAIAVERLDTLRQTPVSNVSTVAEELYKIDCLIEGANAYALMNKVQNGKWLMESICKDLRLSIEAMYAAETQHQRAQAA